MHNTAHYLASFIFNLLIRVVIRTQIQDNLGGFWVARADRIRQLPFDLIFFGYGDYYFRLLHYAQAAGMKVIELPSFSPSAPAATANRTLLSCFLPTRKNCWR